MTIEELANVLPIEIKTKEKGISSGLLEIQKGTFAKGHIEWQVMYYDEHFENAKTLYEAMNKMYKWLLKKKLI